MSIYCGIDPGIKGAIAFYDGLDFLEVHDMPCADKFHTPSHRKRVDAEELANIFRRIIRTHGGIYLALVEDVHSMPSDGHVGAFSFGKSAGVIEGVLGTLGIRHLHIHPGVWKAQLGLNKNKKKSIEMARKVFEKTPGADKLFVRLKEDGRAEASLLAYHCKNKFGVKS